MQNYSFFWPYGSERQKETRTIYADAIIFSNFALSKQSKSNFSARENEKKPDIRDYTPYMDKNIEIDGCQMHYLDEGPESGRVLVVMHGWGCTAKTVRSISDTALACGMRVLTVDFPGFGDSPEPDAVWGVDEYTQLIEKLIHDLA